MIVPLTVDPGPSQTPPAAATSLLATALADEGNPRLLADLLAGVSGDSHGAGLYLADLAAARAAHLHGDNPLLYRAYRDVLPSRLAPHRSNVTAGTGAWFADLVVYPGGTLPGGRELNRSVGHWNTPTQIEIFQCLTGRVLILHTGTDHTGRSTLDYQVCVAGSHVVVPFGAWHLTVVLDGPAATFNVYTDAGALRADRSTNAATQHTHGKYRSAPAPRIAVIDTGCGIAVTGDSAELNNLRIIRRERAPDWARALLEPDGLAAFYLSAADTELARLGDEAVRHGTQVRPHAGPVAHPAHADGAASRSRERDS